MILDPANNLLYVGQGSAISNFGGTWDGSKVYVINPMTSQVVASINIIGPNGFSAESIGLAYDPINKCVYATESSESAIDVINTTTNTVESTIIISPVSAGASLGSIFYDPNNNDLYVANSNSVLGGASDPGIYIINATTNEVVGTLGMSYPTAMAFDSSNNELFVSTWTGMLETINTTTNTITGSMYFGQFSSAGSITFDPANGCLLVGIPYLDEVIVVNATSDTVMQVISVGIHPGVGSLDPINNNVYVVNDWSGTISTIAFSNAYMATFSESSLPGGTNWYVNLSNGQSLSSASSSMSTHLPNGTYEYTIATSDKAYKPEQSMGSIYVNGGIVTKTVAFKEVTQTISFKESGLPAGMDWSVTLNGATESSTTSYVNFTEPNGTYTYSIQSLTGYSSSVSSGTLTISGSNFSQPVLFKGVEYTVKFVENGLPFGTVWNVNLSNGQSFSSDTEIIWLNETDAVYSYTVSADNAAYITTSPSGTFQVDGADVYMPLITFGIGQYEVIFTESGLPAGQTWYVNITGQQPLSSSSDTISLYLTSGSYTFQLATDNQMFGPLPYSGTFSVTGPPVYISARFAQDAYTATFNEQGLPSGDLWYLNVTGQQSSGPLSGNTYSMILPNGTYGFTVSTANKTYRPLHDSGTFTVSGSAQTHSVIIEEVVYSMTFTESGLPVGTEWWVNLSNGQSMHSESSQIQFNESNGTYSYTVLSSDSDYGSSQSSGQVSVNGQNTFCAISFFHKSSPPPNNPSQPLPKDEAYTIGAAAAVVVIAGASAAVMLRKRR